MNILAAAGRGCTPPSAPQLSTQLMDQSPCFSSAQLYITLRVSSWRRDTNCEGRLFTQAFITRGLQGWTGNTGAYWANWALLHRLRVDSPVSHSIAQFLFFPVTTVHKAFPERLPKGWMLFVLLCPLKCILNPFFHVKSICSCTLASSLSRLHTSLSVCPFTPSRSSLSLSVWYSTYQSVCVCVRARVCVCTLILR